MPEKIYKLIPQTREDKKLRIQLATGDDESQLQLDASSNVWMLLLGRRRVSVFVGDEDTSTKYKIVKRAWRDQRAFETVIDAINVDGLNNTFPPKTPRVESRSELPGIFSLSPRELELFLATRRRPTRSSRKNRK